MVVSNSQLVSSQPGDLEAHFAALLEPIRDIAKNWDIDIAHHLEEYLEELDKIQVSFDGGMTTMNFSQAAFVIQKSACVYSKKVEYLYTLVYQVLDLLSSKKKMAKASSLDADGNDQDAGGQHSKDQDEEFLVLDDIKEHKNIDGKFEDDIEMTKLIPRTPMSLIPMDDGEKGENPLLSRTGEVLASRKDFRVNTSNLHACGTMLLDMSHLSQLEASLCMRPASTPAPGHLISRLAQDMAADKEKELSAMNQEGVKNADDGNIDMAEDAGNDFDLLLDDESLGGQPDNDLEPVDENRDGMQLRPRSKAELKPVKIAMKPTTDPWKELDAHEVNAIPEKELRKAKTCKIPPILDKDGNKKRKRKKETFQQKIVPITEFCTKAFHSNKSKFPSNPLKAPSFPEFEQLYWKEFKLRQQTIKQDRKLMMKRGIDVDIAQPDEEEGPETGYNQIAQLDGDEQDDDGDCGFDMPELGDPVLNLLQAGIVEENISPDRTQNMPPMDLAEGTVISSYEDLVRQHVDGFLASAQQYAQITELSKRVTEWEDKILPKLKEEDTHDAFDIHKYGTTVLDTFVTKRKKRVGQDDGEEEEEIEEDTSQTEDPKEKVISFRKIAAGRQPFEVSRLFLATLQLANNYNVEICSKGCLDVGMDTMALRLLSTRRHFEELEEYRAPSIDT